MRAPLTSLGIVTLLVVVAGLFVVYGRDVLSIPSDPSTEASQPAAVERLLLEELREEERFRRPRLFLLRFFF